MAQDNVDTLRRYHDLLNETGEPPAELCHPDIEVHMFKGSPIAGPYLGHDGLRRWREETFDVIKDWRLELDEVITGDDPDVIVAHWRFLGRMRHTDLKVDFPLSVVVRFEDGLISRMDGFRERSEALDAAGLSE